MCSQNVLVTRRCAWCSANMTDRQQLLRLGKLSSSTRRISTGAPQGCVLSPLLFSLYTNDCTSNVPSASFRKVTSLLTDRGLRSWMSGADSLNNLELNTLKIVEMIVDFRRTPPPPPPGLSPRSSQPQFRKTRSSQPRLKLTCACITMTTVITGTTQRRRAFRALFF